MYKKRAIKDYGRETSMFFARCVIALLIVIMLLLLLFFRQFKLQVIDYEAYQTQSENNRIRVRPVAPIRGLIYDRNGVLLAENRSIFALEVVPEQVKNLKASLAELQSLMDIDDKQVEEFKEQIKFRSKFKSYPLKSNLNEQEVALFSVNQHKFPGVSVQARLERYYPHADLLVHAIGRMAAINKNDLEAMDEQMHQNYAASDKMGKLGLERYYEALLHGVVGQEKVETDVHGRVVRVLEKEEPIAGKNLHLHLDFALQQKASEILKQTNSRGAIVAVDPATGGVLALVSQPAYDPNLFTGGISSKNYSRLLSSEGRPLYNRAVQGTYSPASTIKPHLAWIGLQQQVINEQSKVADPGWFSLPNSEHKYRDWKPWGHASFMNVYDSIIQSCDTFFYDLSVKLGIDKISSGMRNFGFGVKSGIDIVEEKIGILPTRQWKKERFRDSWYMGDTVNIGIGQGFWTVTPLQLANATAVLANDGVRYNLQLAKSFSHDTTVEENIPVEAYYQINVGDGRHLDLIKGAMHQVTKPPYGTAKTAFKDAPYLSAAKTGTGQVKSIAQDEKYDASKVEEKFRDNALFVGYAPLQQPKIAIAVVMENAGGGGGNAAPIARQLLDFYLQEPVSGADNEFDQSTNLDTVVAMPARESSSSSDTSRTSDQQASIIFRESDAQSSFNRF